MNKNILKNIDFEAVVSLAELATYSEGQIVSRTLIQNKSVSITIFAFSSGEEISSHESSGDALVYILDGIADVTVGDNSFSPKKGEAIVMPAGIPHAVKAPDNFKMLLIVAFPEQQ